jgi:hypothetical protein
LFVPEVENRPAEALLPLLLLLSVSPVIVMPPAPPVVSALAKSAAFVSLIVVTVPAFALPALASNKLSTPSAAVFLILMCFVP